MDRFINTSRRILIPTMQPTWFFTHIVYLCLSVCYELHELFNSLRLSGAYMRWQPRTSLVQIMACCLFDAKPLSGPMPKYCQLGPGNKLQWRFSRNLNISIDKDAFENVVCYIAAILSRPQWVKRRVWIRVCNIQGVRSSWQITRAMIMFKLLICRKLIFWIPEKLVKRMTSKYVCVLYLVILRGSFILYCCLALQKSLLNYIR